MRTFSTIQSMRFLAGLAACALAQPAAAQFTLQGKTVSVIVSGGVGGGLDAYARVLLPFLSRNLPGEPTMVVQNLPGGGGIQGVQRLYIISAPDGTTLGASPPGPIKEPLMGSGKVNYDLRKFNWIGSLTVEDTVCITWHTSQTGDLEAARSRSVPFASTGAASNSTLVPLVVNDLVGTRIRPIAGYDGGSALLAIERGEVDGQCMTLSSLRASQPRWISEKLIRVLVTVSNVPTPEFPDAPRLADLLKTDEQRQMLQFFLAPGDIFFPWMLPPGAAPEVVAAYRAAFSKAIRDPAYLAEAAKRTQSITARDGAFVQKTIDDMYATPASIIKLVRQATNPTGRIDKRAK